MDFSHDVYDRERIIRAKFTNDWLVQAARAFGTANGKKIILLLTDDLGLNDLVLSYDVIEAK